MASTLLLLFTAYCIATSAIEIKKCNGGSTCSCNGGDDCIIQCPDWGSCPYAQLNCPTGYGCEISCTGSESCENATINAENSLNTKLLCGEYKSCFATTINCPTGYNCETECIGSTEVCQAITIQGSSASVVTLDCDQPKWKLCYDASIYCGETCNILCNGTSLNAQTCGSLHLSTTNTVFFNLNCDGEDSCASQSWVNTASPTTSLPTTAIATTNTPTTVSPTTTSIPTTSVPTTNTPTTFNPTTNVPTTPIPITSIPTTNVPTTSIPTTNVPTTLNPITSMPTSNFPTRAPTTNIPTRAPTTTPNSLPSTSPTYMNEGGVTEIDSTVIENELSAKSSDNILGKFDMVIILIVICALLLVVVGICFCMYMKKRNRFKNAQIINKNTVEMNATNNSAKVEKDRSNHVKNGTLGRNLKSMIAGNDLMMQDIINDVDDIQHVVVTKGGNETNDSETMEDSVDDDKEILDGITLGGDDEDTNTSEGDNVTDGIMTKGHILHIDTLVDTSSAHSDDEIIADDEITITQQ